MTNRVPNRNQKLYWIMDDLNFTQNHIDKKKWFHKLYK